MLLSARITPARELNGGKGSRIVNINEPPVKVQLEVEPDPLLIDNVKRFNDGGEFSEVLFYNNDGGITYASLDNIDGAEWIYSSPEFSIQEINYKKESKEKKKQNKKEKGKKVKKCY